MRTFAKLGIVVLLVSGLGLIASGCAKQQPETPAERGEAVFKLKCQTCHQIDGKGGEKGPDLSTEGSARTADWIETFLKNPFAINPNSKMPLVRMTDEERRDVSEFLAEQKGD